MKNLKLAIVAISFGVAGVALAQAPSTAPRPPTNPIIEAVHVNCAADQERLCSGKTGAAGHQCMIDNDANETPACRDARRKADAFLASQRAKVPSTAPTAAPAGH